MSEVRINWISVKDKLPNKIGPDEYEPVTFVTVKYSDRVSFIILNRIQYGWYDGRYGWRYYDEGCEDWFGYEETYDCEIIAWSRDTIKPYEEEKDE